MKVEIQMNDMNTGFWVYLVKSNKDQFMIKYVSDLKPDNKIFNDFAIQESIEQAERLIKFIQEG